MPSRVHDKPMRFRLPAWAVLLLSGCAVGLVPLCPRLTLTGSSKHGWTPVVVAHLALGADPNSADADGWTPLRHAAYRGHYGTVVALLQRGGDPNGQMGGMSPLHLAVQEGHAAVCAALLASGADPDRRAETFRLLGATVQWDVTPLEEAVRRDERDCASVLLRAGADPNAPNADGGTPLDLARWSGLRDMADLLRQYGAKTGAQIREGCTSLHWAARGGDEQCVELLLAQGAEVNPVAHGLFGRLCTPLDLAVKHPKVARLLLDAGGISTADIRALPPARR